MASRLGWWLLGQLPGDLFTFSAVMMLVVAGDPAWIGMVVAVPLGVAANMAWERDLKRLRGIAP